MNRKYSCRSNRPLVALMVALNLCIITEDGITQGGTNDRLKLDLLVQASPPSSPALMIREGRDFISDEKWDQALQKFDEVVQRFPNGEYTDAALYWKAFVLKKQQKYRGSDQSLQLLMDRFPKSRWIQDAKAMQIEMAAQLGRGDQMVDEARNAENDEIKLIALQSLFQANPERALSYVLDILQPGSASSDRMREGAMSLLGRYGERGGGEQAMKLLLDMALNEQDVRLRKRAIQQLGNGSWSENKFRFEGDDAIIPSLLQLSMDAKDREVAQTAVSALSHIANHHNDPRIKTALLDLGKRAPSQQVREIAISRVGKMAEQDGDAILPDLMALYEANESLEIRKHIISVLSNMESEQAQMKVIDFARNADHNDLRQRAIYVIGSRGTEQGIETLAEIYRQEADREVRDQILNAFSITKHKIGLQKLMEIAQNDPDIKMRMKAVSFLGRSRDPEAQKFLENLLK